MKPRFTFFLLLVLLAALGFWLRPRIVFEPWGQTRLPWPEIPPMGTENGSAHRSGSTPPGSAGVERSGGALLALDADRDGREDIVASRSVPPGAPGALVLWRNLGGRAFSAGQRLVDLPPGVAAGSLARGDLDSDGRDDLLAVGERGSRILLGVEGGFRDASGAWRLSGLGAGGGGALIEDFDGDGRADVLRWGRRVERELAALWLQRAAGTFALLAAWPGGRAVAAEALDADGDPWPDVGLLLWSGEVEILRGAPGGALEAARPELSDARAGSDGPDRARRASALPHPPRPEPAEAGRALRDGLGAPEFPETSAVPEARIPAGSLARGDLDGDGHAELVASGPAGAPLRLARLAANGRVVTRRDLFRLRGRAARPGGAALALADLDGDGDLDVVSPGGDLWREPGERGEAPPSRRGLVFLGQGGGAFREVGSFFGKRLAAPGDALQAVAADLDTDGRVDLAILSRQGPARVLWNELEPRRWIALRLRPAPRRGDVATPPERLGARVIAEAGELRQTAWPIGAGGLRSRAELRFPLGFGHNERVDALRVAWPSGRVDVLRELETNRELWIEEDRGEPEKRPGARPRSQETSQ